MSLTSRKTIFKNGLYNVGAMVVPAILLLVATPLMVKWLDLERYGLWVLCSTLLGLFGLLDFGLKETAITFIPKYLQASDEGGLVRYLRSLLGINFLIGLLASISLYLGSTIVATKIFSLSPQYLSESISTFRILAIGLLPSMTINLQSAIAMGYQRFDISTVLVVVRNLVTMVGTIAVAAYSRSLSEIMVFTVIVSWIFMIIGFISLSRVFPKGNVFLAIPAKREFKEILSFGGYSFLTNISLLSMGVFDKLIIGFFMNPAAVALYSIPMALVSKIEMLVARLAQPLIPHFSAIAGAEHKAKLPSEKSNNAFDISVDASLFVGFGVGALLFILAEPILRLWMGAGFAGQGKWIFRGLLVGYSIRLLNIVPSYIIYGLKKPEINAIANSVAGIVYITLLLLLINKASLGVLSFASAACLITYIILINGISENLQRNVFWHSLPYAVASAAASGIVVYIIGKTTHLNDLSIITVCSLVFSLSYINIAYGLAVIWMSESSESIRFVSYIMTFIKQRMRRNILS